MSYLALPELLAILSMAVMLSRLKQRQGDLRLWVAGLALIVVEGVARILFYLPSSANWHAAMHVVALDAYFLAGIAFFQSATGRLRYLRRGHVYLWACSLPHLLLLTIYGANASTGKNVLAISILALLLTLGGAALLRRPALYYAGHLLVWVPIAVMGWQDSCRQAAYYSLFSIYAATAIGFAVTLSRGRWGRAMIVGGFGVWSLCFLSHPWVAEHHKALLPLADRIWDLQKFFVTFGLMLGSMEEFSEENEYNSLHDALTGLPNRKLLRDRLEQGVARAARSGTRMALLNIDLNGFKQVNDSAGHACGDELLKEIARRLGAVTRAQDTLARVGGDEFLLLVNDLNLSAGATSWTHQGDRLVTLFHGAVEQEPWHYTTGDQKRELFPSLSIGCAVYPDEAADLDDLCRLADQKMYDEKRRGRAKRVERTGEPVVLDERAMVA